MHCTKGDELEADTKILDLRNRGTRDMTENTPTDPKTEAYKSQYNLGQFLESAPLHKRVPKARPINPRQYPPINMNCPYCAREQTFNLSLVVPQPNYGGNETTLQERTFAVVYRCTGHQSGERLFESYIWFLLRFHEDDTVEKLGQYPRQDASINQRLLNLLGDQRFYYRRGLECEVAGYGLGASAYYRRVVESIIDKLLDELREMIPQADRENYEAALDSVEKDRRASERIDAVKHLMPESLNLSGGHNPLKLLHSLLSEDLHFLEEKEILQRSEEMRSLLEYLLIEISEKKNRAVSAKEALAKLLKRTNPGPHEKSEQG